MPEVIDLLDDSSDDERPQKKTKKIVIEDSSDDEVMDVTSDKSDDDDDIANFERAMRQMRETKEPTPKKKKTTNRLTESEKERRAAKRKEERQRKKAEKEAQQAAERLGASRVDNCLKLRSCPSFARAFPGVMELLANRGYDVSTGRQDLGLPSITIEATSEDKSERVIIFVVDAMRRAPEQLRRRVMDAVDAVNESVVALLGPHRDRSLEDVVYLEKRVRLRCLIPPRKGQDPQVKAVTKLSELITSYTTIMVNKLKGDSSNTRNVRADVVADKDDLLSGLDVKDVAKWSGRKPQTNTAAWPAFLRVLLPPNAADAVAKEFSSFASLYAALQRYGPAAVRDLTLNTPTAPRLGPALATKLHTALTSSNSGVVLS